MKADRPPASPTDRPEDERLAPRLLFAYGLQHIVTMYAGVATPPLVIGAAAGLDTAALGVLVSGALLVCGLATLLQTLGVWRFGARLPMVVGISVVPLGIMATFAEERGLPVVFGATFAAGVFGVLIAPFFAALLRFFPPVVTGSVITVIGLSLLPVAANWIIDGEASGHPSLSNLALGGITLLIMLVLYRLLPPSLAGMSVLLGLVLGTVIAVPFGRVDFGSVLEGPVFSFGQPLYFGLPEFDLVPIVTMCVVMLVILTEGTADTLAVGQVIGTPIDRRRIADGLRADAGSALFAPLFNSFPCGVLAQNIGVIALTGVRSRFVVATGGATLVLLGLFPVLGRVIAIIPMPVLGGAALLLFGTIAISGVRTLGTVDFGGNGLNLIIAACSIGVGIVPVAVPGFYDAFPGWAATILGSGIIGASVVAVLLNIVFNVIGPRATPAPIVPHQATAGDLPLGGEAGPRPAEAPSAPPS
ncbi:nucleobase:cation symporter-2 family protein [Marinactinospora endophytica]